MPLPETIPVRYTEEDAGYVTVRPIVRQTFRLNELLDMILSVTGKDAARIRKILLSGTVVYHFFRYTWAAVDATEAELAPALAQFPDANPSRKFISDECTMAVFEGGSPTPRHLLDLDRATALKRRIFRAQSFWDRLLEIASEENPAYQTYSYGRRADLFRLLLNERNAPRIADAANRLASGQLRVALRVLSSTEYLLFVCPRSAGAKQPNAG